MGGNTIHHIQHHNRASKHKQVELGRNMIAKPLISPTSSSSSILNGMEESSYPTIPIKLPLTDDSEDYGWSNFPCYSDDNIDDITSLLPLASSILSRQVIPAYPSPATVYQDNEPDVVTSKSTLYSLRDYIPRALPPPSPTSCCDVVEITPSTISPSKIRKRVSFAALVRVRTHTIVLGDHPMCSGGMALQLGWESSKTQYVPLTSCGGHSWTTRRSSTNRKSLAQFRLNYQQRRQRLMELTGYSSCQLLHQEYLLVCCGTYSGETCYNNPPTTANGDA